MPEQGPHGGRKQASGFSVNLLGDLWREDGEYSYGAALYGPLGTESRHEIYSACSWLPGGKPAVFRDALMTAFKVMCLTDSFPQALAHLDWLCPSCVPHSA